jgi:hypothetical protein
VSMQTDSVVEYLPEIPILPRGRWRVEAYQRLDRIACYCSIAARTSSGERGGVAVGGRRMSVSWREIRLESSSTRRIGLDAPGGTVKGRACHA